MRRELPAGKTKNSVKKEKTAHCARKEDRPHSHLNVYLFLIKKLLTTFLSSEIKTMVNAPTHFKVEMCFEAFISLFFSRLGFHTAIISSTPTDQ